MKRLGRDPKTGAYLYPPRNRQQAAYRDRIAQGLCVIKGCNLPLKTSRRCAKHCPQPKTPEYKARAAARKKALYWRNKVAEVCYTQGCEGTPTETSLSCKACRRRGNALALRYYHEKKHAETAAGSDPALGTNPGSELSEAHRHHQPDGVLQGVHDELLRGGGPLVP